MRLAYKHLSLKPSTTLIVAVSGGPDSMGLLHLFFESGFKKLIVAHLDHQIRKESFQDAELVKNAAKKYGYVFELKKLPIRKIAGKENLEAVGRDERYKFFRVLKKKYKAKYIVTAHHADDQIETVLMNILRGTGLEGLAGMQETEGDLWRPLLAVSKQEIETYCTKKKLKFVREATNEDVSFRRNFLRLKVVPRLKEMNPNLLGTMKKNIDVWSSASKYFQKEALTALENIRLNKIRFDLKKFLLLDELLQAIVLRLIFEEVHGHKKNLIQEHLEQLLKVIRTNVSGKKKEFGAGKMLVKQKTFFEIQNR